MRITSTRAGFAIALLVLTSSAFRLRGSELEPAQVSPQSTPRLGQEIGRVYKDRITPHWFQNNTRFWYRNDLRGGAKQFVLIDAERGTLNHAFDHDKLAAGLSAAAGTSYHGDQLPFSDIQFSEDATAILFKVGETAWKCELNSYQCTKTDASVIRASTTEAPEDSNNAVQGRRGRGQRPAGRNEPRRFTDRSPDGKRTASIKDHNVFVSSGEEADVQLSTDGKEGLGYGRVEWSPDSKSVVAFRIEPGERKEVHLIQSSPNGGGRAKLQSRPYALPGDKFTTYELNLFDVTNQKQIKPTIDRFEHGWEAPSIHWHRDGHRFSYQQVDRGHQRLRVIEVDFSTGATRNLIDEKSETFIWTAHTETLGLTHVNWLEKTDEFIYASERDGWRHLYLVDIQAGQIRNQITTGEWVVRGIDRIDEEKRQIWFNASGKNPNQDPYLIHHYRVNFDGSELVALTEGNGNHAVSYSPDRQYIIDTYSRVDESTVNELRRVSDGKLVCTLEEADIAELEASGWRAPEVFVSKARDGKTDIWGIICRPQNFDATRKYPVLEQIYAGPQGSFVPKTFSAARRFASLTDLGFVVVQIDGMGTANRSKAFHDVCWKNLKDAGFEDRILWMKAAALKHPEMDLNRVGIYGTSAGGQNAAAAVLFHPEFYKAAVANCGCHDNRMDKASWNEQWMGFPVGLQYSECSNIDNARRLRGKLFLIVGEMDTNVPPESTMRFADALIKAGKDFDLLVVPGADHGTRGPASSYVQRRMNDFFVRHLLGSQPPDRNAETLRQATDEALLKANDTIRKMFAYRHDILKALIADGVRLVVLGRNEKIADLPEYKSFEKIEGFDALARTLEYSSQNKLLVVAEENLMGNPRTTGVGDNQVIRVFARALYEVTGRREIDPNWENRGRAVQQYELRVKRLDSRFDERLKELFEKSLAAGKWKGTAAIHDRIAYWVEGVLSYFDASGQTAPPHDSAHPISTREALHGYDAELYALIAETMAYEGHLDWRYRP